MKIVLDINDIITTKTSYKKNTNRKSSLRGNHGGQTMSEKPFHIAVPVYGLLVYQPLRLVFVSKKWVV